MNNIIWEDVSCHLCASKVPREPVKLKGVPLVDGQFGYAVHPEMCRCGLVYLNPRWSKKDFIIFYTNYYDDLYRLEIKSDYGIEGVIENMKIIWKRIQHMVDGGIKNILDVGCGSGFGLKYLKTQLPYANLFGIESSPECCATLQSKDVGATLVTTDFDSDWMSGYKNKFDLIILRHVIEHMTDPIPTLKKLKTVLSENGFIYFATPDMMHPRIHLRDYDEWWQYWFRAVHPYYYNKATLCKTLELAELYPSEFGEDMEEVWCTALHRKTQHFPFENVYGKQTSVLDELLP